MAYTDSQIVRANEITKVTYRWDSQDPKNEGWYCESWATEEDGTPVMIDESQKIWFGVDTDDFDAADAESLEAALQEKFPNAEIVAQ